MRNHNNGVKDQTPAILMKHGVLLLLLLFRVVLCDKQNLHELHTQFTLNSHTLARVHWLSITSTHKTDSNEWINEFHSKVSINNNNKHPIRWMWFKNIFCVRVRKRRAHVGDIIFIKLCTHFFLSKFLSLFSCVYVCSMGPPLHCGRIQRKNTFTDNNNKMKKKVIQRRI